MNEMCNESGDNRVRDRRSFLASLGTFAIAPFAPLSMQPAATLVNSLTKEQRDSLTPSQVVDELKRVMSGSERQKGFLAIIWRRNDLVRRDNIRQQSSSDVWIPEYPRRSYSMLASATRSSDGLQATS